MANKETFLQTLDHYGAALLKDPTSDEVIRLRNLLVTLAGFNPKAQRGAEHAYVDEHQLADKSGPL